MAPALDFVEEDYAAAPPSPAPSPTIDFQPEEAAATPAKPFFNVVPETAVEALNLPPSPKAVQAAAMAGASPKPLIAPPEGWGPAGPETIGPQDPANSWNRFRYGPAGRSLIGTPPGEEPHGNPGLVEMAEGLAPLVLGPAGEMAEAGSLVKNVMTGPVGKAMGAYFVEEFARKAPDAYSRFKKALDQGDTSTAKDIAIREGFEGVWATMAGLGLMSGKGGPTRIRSGPVNAEVEVVPPDQPIPPTRQIRPPGGLPSAPERLALPAPSEPTASQAAPLAVAPAPAPPELTWGPGDRPVSFWRKFTTPLQASKLPADVRADLVKFTKVEDTPKAIAAMLKARLAEVEAPKPKPPEEPPAAEPPGAPVPKPEPPAPAAPAAAPSPTPTDPAATAKAFGMRLDKPPYGTKGQNQFTLFDESGKESTTFLLPADATPEQIRAKYEAKRAEYDANDPNRPRLLPAGAGAKPSAEREAAPAPTTAPAVSGPEAIEAKLGLKFRGTDEKGSPSLGPMDKYETPAGLTINVPRGTDEAGIAAKLAERKGAAEPAAKEKAALEAPAKPTAPVKGSLQDIRERLARGEKPSPEAGGGELHGMLADFGRTLYQKGMAFADWAKSMISELGERVVGALKSVWERVVATQVGARDLATMTPDELVAWKKKAGYGPDLMQRMADQVKPEDVPALTAERDRLRATINDALSTATPETIDKIWKEQAGASVKAQTLNEMIEHAPKPPEPPTGLAGGVRAAMATGKTPGGEAAFIRLPNLGAAWTKASQTVDKYRGAFGQIFRSGTNRKVMDQTRDAADNAANIMGQQMGKRVSIGTTPEEDTAASAIVASGFDQTKLGDFLLKAIKGKNADAEAGIRLAMKDWNRLVPIARRGQAIFDAQIQREQGAGINTEFHEAYLPGIYDRDLLMGVNRPFVISGTSGGGIATGFKKGKVYDTPFDAIADGYKPKTLRLSQLVEHRVRVGQKLVNVKDWADSLRTFVDPTNQKPIVESMIRKSRGPGQPGYEVAPPGYSSREIIPGTRIAVHEGYEKLFDALTGRSQIGEFEVGGVPVGTLALKGAGAIKHGLLLFDTFHASRIFQKQLFLTGEVGYKKGVSLLEYSNADLSRAVANGDITQEMADYARANRPDANALIQNGLNVGRISEGLYSSIIRELPIIGTMNKWVFDKATRGAIMQSGLIEFDRVQRANPGMARDEVARQVARDTNVYFGNLGRQGVFKSQTFLDASRLVALAPQWFEGMVRTEAGAAKQIAVDPILQRRLKLGTLGKGMAQGLAAYFIGTQLLNLATRHKLTFQNDEKGHKFDAWIPDVTGKSPGFWLSPMSVVAEITHDAIHYSRTEPDAIAAAARILENKASPYVRAGKVLLSGETWDKKKLVGAWERARAAAVALAPTPLPFAGFQSATPGSVQRQLTASAGVKTEPVEKPGTLYFESLPTRVRAYGGMTDYAIGVSREARKLPISQRAAFVRERLATDNLQGALRARAWDEIERHGTFNYK